ncbi:TonB family C-terminal domain protein [delta proteobacterium NaphS2]|nr:TonB family C-terminal domain protein [delta proteobacterium NaphS2]
MGTLRAKTMSDRSGEPGWTGVILLSLFLHVGVLSLLLFAPDPFATRKISGPVYEVNLVTLPAAKPKAAAKTVQPKRVTTKVPASTKAVATKRISTPPKPEKPVSIAKRTVERKKPVAKKPPKPKKPKVSPSKLIDQAVAKIKRNVNTEKKVDQHLDKAISNIQNQVNRAEAAGAGGPPMEGIAIRIYQMEVEERIKSNWQYPVALTSPSKLKDLVATVVVRVQRDGTILRSWFIERSGNAIYDASVMKAVERSNPLPPFPEGYNRNQDEMEIRFNLSELEDN